MKNKQINSFDELINLLENNSFTDNQKVKIIQKCLQVYIIADEHPNLINDLKSFWVKYGNLPLTSRPLFLSGNSDLKSMNKIPELKKIIDEIEQKY
ncbi:hypothetical protein [Flavobacterium sp. PL002]|uniref:hypothetical protein n=1 Tax=Flavobacterium sp. PL002 TaxID=1897058 RepID=UPI001787BD93|nr:hypothetical protein [Flavobacterium sp. PL002]MBE0390192.1 hypothetical protein [Flavobacterium sp. PL002]